MTSEKVHEGPVDEETGMDPDVMDEDIEELTEEIGQTIEESEERFKSCPKCGLPTFIGPDGRSAFCARCWSGRCGMIRSGREGGQGCLFAGWWPSL